MISCMYSNITCADNNNTTKYIMKLGTNYSHNKKLNASKVMFKFDQDILVTT